MKEIFRLKLNVYILLLIIPLSLMGSFLAVNHESWFFLYEWSLVLVVIFSIIYALMNAVTIKGNLKWTALSTLVFLLQFSVFGLFLGPFTYLPMIFLYYLFAIASPAVFILTISKNEMLRAIPISFIVLTGLFTVYMVFLNALWGSHLS